MKDGNAWVQARTLFRSAVDVLRRAEVAMTAREIADALVADKAPQATRKQAIDLQARSCPAEARRVDGYWRGCARPVGIGLLSAPNLAPSYCRIRECYPDGAIGADDPTSIDRLSFGSFEARATRGAVGGSGPS